MNFLKVGDVIDCKNVTKRLNYQPKIKNLIILEV